MDALARGDFDDLPGAGKPLPEEDLALVPAELRAGFRILKNAGYVPPEVEARKEAASLRALISCLDDEQTRARALIKLQLLNMRMSGCGKSRLDPEGAYGDAVLDRLAGEY